MSKSTNANGNFERRILFWNNSKEFAISLRSPGNEHWKDRSGNMYARSGIIDHNDPGTREWTLFDVIEGDSDGAVESTAREIAANLKGAFLLSGKQLVTVSALSETPQANRI